MPGAWQLRPSNDPHRWFYRSADHREHLTITLGDDDPIRTDADREAALRRAVTRSRRAAELGFARMPETNLTEPQYGDHAGTPAARYVGDAGPAHRFSALLLAGQDSIWILFYEAFRMTEADAEAHASAIFDSVAFR